MSPLLLAIAVLGPVAGSLLPGVIHRGPVAVATVRPASSEPAQPARSRTQWETS